MRKSSTLTGKQHPFGLSANRYLILIAYMFGLAIGVHLAQPACNLLYSPHLLLRGV